MNTAITNANNSILLNDDNGSTSSNQHSFAVVHNHRGYHHIKCHVVTRYHSYDPLYSSYINHPIIGNGIIVLLAILVVILINHYMDKY